MGMNLDALEQEAFQSGYRTALAKLERLLPSYTDTITLSLIMDDMAWWRLEKDLLLEGGYHEELD